MDELLNFVDMSQHYDQWQWFNMTSEQRQQAIREVKYRETEVEHHWTAEDEQIWNELTEDIARFEAAQIPKYVSLEVLRKLPKWGAYLTNDIILDMNNKPRVVVVWAWKDRFVGGDFIRNSNFDLYTGEYLGERI